MAGAQADEYNGVEWSVVKTMGIDIMPWDELGSELEDIDPVSILNETVFVPLSAQNEEPALELSTLCKFCVAKWLVENTVVEESSY